MENPRGKLLQDQQTLAEEHKYARETGLESVEQHIKKVENQTSTEVSVKQEVVDSTGKKSCIDCEIQWPQQREPRKCPSFELKSSAREVEKLGTIWREIVKPNKKLKLQEN